MFTLNKEIYQKGRFSASRSGYPEYFSPAFSHSLARNHRALPDLLGRFKYKPGQVRAFGMLVGGAKITSVFQIETFSKMFEEMVKEKKTKKGLRQYALHTFSDF
ncbi:putative cytochrome-b5 reductase [Helianthus debilis subsp. tardiflorus]